MFTLLLVLITVFASVFVFAEDTHGSVSMKPPEPTQVWGNTDDPELAADFFYGDGCPHCAEMEKYFEDELIPNYPQIQIKMYEVWKNQVNAIYFTEKSKELGSAPRGVPTLVVGEDMHVGFGNAQTSGPEVETLFRQNLGLDVDQHSAENETVVYLPLIGPVNLAEVSLPIITIVIAAFDSFNPCAMWVLTFLLTLLIYSESRKKMLLVGGIFVLTSGIIYFIFMAAWFNFFRIIGYTKILQVLIGLMAVGAGAINLKDFFFFKKGVSLTISDEHKTTLIQKMRNLVHEEATFAVVIGSIVLAVTANLFELLCTAGLPAIYTRILVDHNFPILKYYAYLVLYNIVYIIPLAVIVGIFVVTLGRKKLSEKEGKWLKLLGGLLMLILGLVLIFRPELLAFG